MKLLNHLLGAALVAALCIGGSGLQVRAAVPETTIIHDASGLADYLNGVQAGTAEVNGKVVTLKKSITVSNFVSFQSKANVTLDLEGYTVTFGTNAGFSALTGGTFTLTDAGSVVGDGVPTVQVEGGTVNIVKDTDTPHASTCSYTKGVPAVIQKSASSSALACIYSDTADMSVDSALNIGDVYIDSSSYGITLTGGTTTIKNASVHAAFNAISANMATPANYASDLHISGGTYESAASSTVEISGTGYTDANDCTAKLNFSGGTFTTKAKSYSAISLSKGAELVIPEDNSVSFSTNGGKGILTNNSKVTISNVTVPGIYVRSGSVLTAADSEIIYDDAIPVTVTEYSTVIFKNTNVTTENPLVILFNDSVLSAESGTFLSTSAPAYSNAYLIKGTNSQFTLKNCTLEGGQGLYLNGSNLSVEGTTIKSTFSEEDESAGYGINMEGGSSAYIESTEITANRGIRCYDGSSLTFLSGTVTGLYPVDVDYCNANAKICIVDSVEPGITLKSTGGNAPILVAEESADNTTYGLLQLSENVYNNYVKTYCSTSFVNDTASGSYVTEKTDLSKYRESLVGTPETYYVTYVGTEGADNADLNPTEVNSLKSYKLVSLTKDGYVFGGWYTDASYKQSITEINLPTKNLTLYAKFTKINTAMPKLNYKVDTKAITLSWTKISGADTYAIYKASGQGMKLLKKTTSTSYKDTKVTNGTNYQYQVFPCFSDQSGTPSKEIYIRFYNKAASVKVSTISTGNKLTVSGVPTSYVTYTIYRSDNGGAYKVLKTQAGKTTTYTDTKVTNGHKYTYYVIYQYTKIVYANYAKSPASAKVTTCYLKAPKLSSVKNTAKKTATVKWAKNTGATGYQLQYGLKSSFSGAKTVTLKKKTYVSKKLKSLKKKKTYYVRIRAYKTVSGKKYYSVWSGKKRVKIRK